MDPVHCAPLIVSKCYLLKCWNHLISVCGTHMGSSQTIAAPWWKLKIYSKKADAPPTYLQLPFLSFSSSRRSSQILSFNRRLERRNNSFSIAECVTWIFCFVSIYINLRTNQCAHKAAEQCDIKITSHWFMDSSTRRRFKDLFLIFTPFICFVFLRRIFTCFSLF